MAAELTAGAPTGSRRRIAAVVAAAALVIGGAAAAVRLTGSSAPSHPAASTATTTVAVTRTDLAETTPVNGTVGFASPVTVSQPAGTAPQAITQAQQAVAAAEGNVTSDQTAFADTHTADVQGIGQAQAALTAAKAALASDQTQLQDDQATAAAAQAKQSNDCTGAGAAGGGGSGSAPSSPCAADTTQLSADQAKVGSDQQKVAADQTGEQNAEAQVTSAQQKAGQGTDQANAKLAADAQALANAQAALATAQAEATTFGQTSKYTALPAVGQVLNPGAALWSVDGAPTCLLQGAATAWRAFQAGMAPGADVTELDQALIALGDGAGLTPSDTFTAATAAAIDRLQASIGLAQTGALPLGSVVFEPAAVRVTAVHPAVGSPVQGGSPVLDLSSTAPIVNVALPVDQTNIVKVGDPVTVDMPDRTTATGVITAVGTVATNTTPSNGNPNPTATVNVTVALSHPSAAGTLDSAPVSVHITNASASGVLAVPITSLLALAGGGYAVEIVAADGTHHLVPVTTGLFDDQAGLVQVSGDGLAEGQKVVTAA